MLLSCGSLPRFPSLALDQESANAQKEKQTQNPVHLCRLLFSGILAPYVLVALAALQKEFFLIAFIYQRYATSYFFIVEN